MKARVSEVSINEGLIYIDRGADSGFTSGTTVCFAISPGKEQVCGKVKTADAAKAVVEVETGAKEITVGTEAVLGTEEKPGMPAKAKADWFR